MVLAVPCPPRYLVRRDAGSLNMNGRDGSPKTCSGYDKSCWADPMDVSAGDNCWHPTEVRCHGAV